MGIIPLLNFLPPLSQEEKCVNDLSRPVRLLFPLLLLHRQLDLLFPPRKLLLSSFVSEIFLFKLLLLELPLPELSSLFPSSRLFFLNESFSPVDD